MNEKTKDLREDFLGQCKIDSKSDFEQGEEDTESRDDSVV